MSTMTVPPPETLPEFMRRMRERKKDPTLTQKEAAEALKISERLYQMWENDEGPILPKYHRAIAELFGVTEHVIRMVAEGRSVDLSGYAGGILYVASELERQVAQFRMLAATPGALDAAHAGKSVAETMLAVERARREGYPPRTG